MEKKIDKLEAEVKITYEEYKKMKKKFPYHFWKQFLIASIIIFVIWSLGSLEEPNEVSILIPLIFVFLILKIIDVMSRKMKYVKILRKSKDDVHYMISFYDDYLEKKTENIVQKIPYYQIWKIRETETHIYLLLDKENIIPIKKEECDEKIIRKIQKISLNKDNNEKNKEEYEEEYEEYITPKEKYAKMRKFLIFLFILTIVSIWIAILIPLGLADMNMPHYVMEYFPDTKVSISIFTVSMPYAPVLDYLWGTWLLLPIPLLSMILGIKYYRKGLKCKKNIVAGIIVMILLLLMGSMTYINPVEQEYKNAFEHQEILGVKLPKKGRLFKIKLNQTKNPQLIYMLWNNRNDANSLYKEIKENKNWIPLSKVDPKVSTSLISECMSQKEECYYSIYIEEVKEYNKLPDKNGLYNIHSMLYDPEISSLKMEQFTDFIRIDN